MQEPQASASGHKKTERSQLLLTFFIVLNLGALVGQMRLFQTMENKKEEMEAQSLRMVTDSLQRKAQVDSLTRALQWAITPDSIRTGTAVKPN